MKGALLGKIIPWGEAIFNLARGRYEVLLNRRSLALRWGLASVGLLASSVLAAPMLADEACVFPKTSLLNARGHNTRKRPIPPRKG
jgi:hypothetical protein